MMPQQVEPAGGLTRSSTEVKLWSTYVLRADGSATLPGGTKIEAGAVIYAGRSRRPENRLKSHVDNASSLAARSQQAVFGLIHELSLLGVGVTLEVVADGLRATGNR